MTDTTTTTEAPPTRPESVPEAFWDSEKNTVKTEDLVKSWSELNAKVNPPEPTAEEKTAKEKADAEAKTAAQADLVKSYGDFAVPEGFTVDAEAMGKAKELFAGMNIPKEAAQQLLDMHAGQAAAVATAVSEANDKAWKDLHAEWTATIEKDPDIGGAKLAGARATIAKVVDNLGIPGLSEALKLTGADNNPAIVKALWKMAVPLSEGGHYGGKPAGTGAPKSLEERIYPDGGNKNIAGRPPVETT